MEYVEFVRLTGLPVGQGSTPDMHGGADAVAKAADFSYCEAVISSMDDAMDAYFRIAASQRLQVHDLAAFDASLAHLEHCILDNPSGLRSHVRRIFLLMDHGNSTDLPGALVDLLIALGDKGQALKRHLLALAAPQLPSAVAALLEQHLESGFAPWRVFSPAVRSSLLLLGYSGEHELVHRRDAEQAGGYTDAMEEARDRLAYGQLDAAREVLEQVLRQTPDHAEAAAELLAIYRSTKDAERLALMRCFLADALPVLPPGWHMLSPLDELSKLHERRQ